ncbi:MAG TPA: molybdopterin-dependent oxidoreductase [Actinomycetales bacterium]|nr:molybdopterin-dependent oxidoreductase [Actinomycetales bacterium]
MTDAEGTLPPGQRRATSWRVMHYGRVPAIDPTTWTVTVTGATLDGSDHALGLDELQALPRVRIVADLHCVSRWTIPDLVWEGVAGRTLVDLFPPRDDVEHVRVWAAYGYSATIRLEDLVAGRTLLATATGGAPLTPEQGWPVRLVVPHLYGFKGPKWLRSVEYLTEPVRGFWEERGYHLHGDPWRQERYSYQE